MEAFPNAALSVCVPWVQGEEIYLFIAGFSLQLELLSTPATFHRGKEHAARGLPSYYYTLHVSADNLVPRHGAIIIRSLDVSKAFN